MTTRQGRKTPFYKTKICPWYFKKRCTRGEDCQFAHSNEELRSAPDLAKTSLCPNIKKNGSCNDQECMFAHSTKELRFTEDIFKTLLCKGYRKGTCLLGDACRYAHGENELRKVMESCNEKNPHIANELPESDVNPKTPTENETSDLYISEALAKSESLPHYYKFRDFSDRTSSRLQDAQLHQSRSHHKEKMTDIITRQSYQPINDVHWTLPPLDKSEADYDDIYFIDQKISQYTKMRDEAIANRLIRTSSHQDLSYTNSGLNHYQNPPPIRAKTLLSAMESMASQRHFQNFNQINSQMPIKCPPDTSIFSSNVPHHEEYLAEHPISAPKYSHHNLTKSTSCHNIATPNYPSDTTKKLPTSELNYSSLPSTTWISEEPLSPKSECPTISRWPSRSSIITTNGEEQSAPHCPESNENNMRYFFEKELGKLTCGSHADQNRGDPNLSGINYQKPYPDSFLETLYREMDSEVPSNDVSAAFEMYSNRDINDIQNNTYPFIY